MYVPRRCFNCHSSAPTNRSAHPVQSAISLRIASCTENSLSLNAVKISRALHFICSSSLGSCVDLVRRRRCAENSCRPPMGMVTAGDTQTVLFDARWRQIRYTESTNHLSKYKSSPTHSKPAPSTLDRRTVPTEQRNCLPTSYSPQVRSSS